MDPNATWKMLAEAIEAGNDDEATEAAESLEAWLLKNGFPPHITGNAKFDRYVATATCHALLYLDK